jgi:hypothetical protein
MAYPSGSAADFANCYVPAWGSFKSRTRPAIGNHEYDTGSPAAYFNYFGSLAGDPVNAYYSYDVGAWHVVVLNSNCSKITGGCAVGGAQEKWLRADLGANPTACTLAYFHHPRFSSLYPVLNTDGSTLPLWQALYDAGAELVLNGHAHVYERFAALTPAGVADPARGVREFTVGTGGGEPHSSWNTPRAQNSEVFNDRVWGVLQLTLHANSYDWNFIGVPGTAFTDAGSGACH